MFNASFYNKLIIINKMTSWYTHLNRDQAYLRSYRTHNLWLDQYHRKIRTSRITPFHIGVLKRLGKTYSGVSAVIGRDLSSNV